MLHDVNHIVALSLQKSAESEFRAGLAPKTMRRNPVQCSRPVGAGFVCDRQTCWCSHCSLSAWPPQRQVMLLFEVSTRVLKYAAPVEARQTQIVPGLLKLQSGSRSQGGRITSAAVRRASKAEACPLYHC